MTAGAVERSVRRDLRRLPDEDRLSGLAAAAVLLARLLDVVAADGPGEDGKVLSASAQAARELRSTMGELMKHAPRARSGIDDLRARRAARSGRPASKVAVPSAGG